MKRTLLNLLLFHAFISNCVYGHAVQSHDAIVFTKYSLKRASIEPIQLVPKVSGRQLQWHGVPIASLVKYAYNIPATNIVGTLPSRQLYSIDATLPPSTSVPDIREMFQALLRDRFTFQCHLDSRAMTTFTLVTTSTTTIGATTYTTGRPMVSGRPINVPDNYVGVFALHDGIHLLGANITTEQLSHALADIVGRPVLDGVKLAGTYNINIRFAQDSKFSQERTQQLRDALRSDLGFDLRDGRSLVETLVVDHVGEPRIGWLEKGQLDKVTNLIYFLGVVALVFSALSVVRNLARRASKQRV